MISKRFLLAAIAFALMLPLPGCGCRRSSCCESRAYAPPPAPCCPTAPAGYTPGVQP
jgi:hypothetical protein